MVPDLARQHHGRWGWASASGHAAQPL